MKDIAREVESIYNDFGNTLVPIQREFNISSRSSSIIGYCSKHSDIYNVVYPKTGNSEIDDRIRMHEYGHIYCGHLEGIYEEMDTNLSRILRNKDSQLIKLINENCNIDYADKIIDKVISDPYLNHFIHNLAMDMEVNSTILDEDDLNIIKDEMNQMIYEEYMVLSENGKKLPSMEYLSNLYSKFDLKAVHPSDFGFPSGLTYPDYLVQLVLRLDLVINMMSESLNNKGKSKDRLESQSEKMESEANGGSSNESGEDSDETNNSNAPSCNDNSYVPKTKDEFEEMMRNANASNSREPNDSDDESQSSHSSSSEGNSNDGEGKDTSSSDGSEDEESNESNSRGGKGKDDDNNDNDDHGTDSRRSADEKRLNDLGNYAHEGGSGRGLNESDSERNYQINNDPLTMSLEEIIREFRHKVIKRDFVKDMTHKYNRKILGKDNKMLSPTYRQKITRSENPTIAFYVDVSGSMDTSLVDRIITTIRFKMRNIDRSLLYNIIAWDTSLCNFYKNIDFNSPIPKLRCGGGTQMEGCFDHFKENFGMDAIMILISDFGDDLDSWNKKEMNMNGYSMYGLRYGSEYYRDVKFKNFKVRYCGS